MGRAPCCEKIGLKRGPWTQEEDKILVAYIQSHGHENWRALPKHAGLLRCGKSCRLRWINYLRPDIKRGNFSQEEEEMIIQLHETLGNRWSAIAARLPGRTDNEIKNVWHTHLKKRLKPKQDGAEPNVMAVQTSPTPMDKQDQNQQSSTSPARSCSAVSTSTSTSATTTESLQEFPEIDESFWSEALSMDVTSVARSGSLGDLCPSFGSAETEGDLSFWLRVFMETGAGEELPAIEMF